MKIDPEKGESILGNYRAIAAEHNDPVMLRKIQDYKQKIASRFQSIRRDDIPTVFGNEFFISLKLDGEHCCLYYEHERAYVIRHRGEAYSGLPLLDEAAAALKAAGVRHALLPGEFYKQKQDGSRSRVADIVSLSKSPKSEENLSLMNFAPFDILEMDDLQFDRYAQIYERLEKIFGASALKPPPTIISRNRNDISKYYKLWVEDQGYEGLMIRSDLPFRYKLKADHTIDAVIIGYTGGPERGVHSALTALMTPAGEFQVLTEVSKGFSPEFRVELFGKLQALAVKSGYMEVDRGSSTYRMVRPEFIIEFSSNDIVAERASGKPYLRMLLEFTDDCYQPLRSVPGAGMKHTVFQRMRSDKSVSVKDLRLSQITDLIALPAESEVTTTREIESPEILLREVYSKSLKGKLAVRKIVVWKTNREGPGSSFLGYTVNYTDFSPDRAEPLKQDVCISNSREQALELAGAFREKNIKSGWVRSGSSATEVSSEGDALQPQAKKKIRSKGSLKVEPKKTGLG